MCCLITRKLYRNTLVLRRFAEEREEDLKLLNGPEGVGGPAKMLVPKAVDADDSDGDAGASDSSDSDDDEDEEAELLAELERIKKERAEEAARKAAVDAEADAARQQAELLRGNPLLEEKLAVRMGQRQGDMHCASNILFCFAFMPSLSQCAGLWRTQRVHSEEEMGRRRSI